MIAAGLGHTELVEYILEKNPKAANMTDNEGKLPLHYAAAVKDAGNIYNMLVEAGADERTQDNVRTGCIEPGVSGYHRCNMCGISVAWEQIFQK
uniref:(California timema) hypothetical protein n=1 Tax=Timema californicum TaxID=61474 RepID=A0A7R9JKZ3_TIMCA|nr:unnamed protein product [Timema californicum]